MIIVPNNFILADDLPSGLTPDHPIIGWHNLVTNSSIVADSQDPLFPIRNVANPLTFSRWKSLTSAQQSLMVTTGYVDEIDYVGFGKHNFGTQGVQVQIKNGATVLVPANVPADDKPLLYRFQGTSVAQLEIVLESNGGPPECAVIYVGKLLVLPRKIYVPHKPITMARTLNSVTGMSMSGNYLGEVTIGGFSSTSFTMQNLLPAWIRAEFEPFKRARLPFFWGWRPGSYPAEVGYCWLSNHPQPQNQRSAQGFMQVDVQMTGII